MWHVQNWRKKKRKNSENQDLEDQTGASKQPGPKKRRIISEENENQGENGENQCLKNTKNDPNSKATSESEKIISKINFEKSKKAVKIPFQENSSKKENYFPIFKKVKPKIFKFSAVNQAGGNNQNSDKNEKKANPYVSPANKHYHQQPRKKRSQIKPSASRLKLGPGFKFRSICEHFNDSKSKKIESSTYPPPPPTSSTQPK